MDLGCSSDGVVVHTDGHILERFIFGFQKAINFLVGHVLLKHLLRKQFHLSVDLTRGILDLLLGIRSRREVTSPIIVITLSIWHRVLVPHWPLDLLSFHSVHIVTWCGQLEFHINRVVLINIVYHPTDSLVVLECILEREVAAHHYEDVVSHSLESFTLNEVDEVHHLLLGVEGGQCLICDKSIISIIILATEEARWVTVIIWEDIS